MHASDCSVWSAESPELTANCILTLGLSLLFTVYSSHYQFSSNIELQTRRPSPQRMDHSDSYVGSSFQPDRIRSPHYKTTSNHVSQLVFRSGTIANLFPKILGGLACAISRTYLKKCLAPETHDREELVAMNSRDSRVVEL